MYEIKASGMTCGGCVKSVTNAIKSVDAKAEVEVDLATQTIKVKSNKDKTEIINSVIEAGFPVENMR